MNNMAFNPVGGLTDSSAYPTAPATEAAARSQIQDPSNQLRDYINTNFSTPFMAQSLDTSGYQKLPGGLIIQWGIILFGGSGGVVTWTYPTTFPNRAVYANCDIYWGSNPSYTSMNTSPGTSSTQFTSSVGSNVVSGYCFAIGY